MKLTVLDLLGFSLGVILVLLSQSCYGTEVGVHLVSAHVPAKDYQNNVNLGLYVINDNGWTFGAYRNTSRRLSVYAGQTFSYGPASVAIGLITGYDKRRVWYKSDKPCLDGVVHDICWRDEGISKSKLTPIIAPSFDLGAVRVWYIPRIGSSSSVIHLSLEITL